jgi:hypothetical protein
MQLFHSVLQALRPYLAPTAAIGSAYGIYGAWSQFVTWLYGLLPHTIIVSLAELPAWGAAVIVFLAVWLFGIGVNRLIEGGHRRLVAMINRLYAEGVGLRNTAFSLHVLPADLHAQIEKNWKNLVEAIHRLTPEKAITVETLNTYDPTAPHHPRCNLRVEDQKDAYEFSEVLFRVQTILRNH